MPILNISPFQIGQSGIDPAFVFISTNNTLAQILAPGYLNGAVQKFGIPLSESQAALVSTKTSPNSGSTQVGMFGISKSGDNWSLITPSSSSTVTLPTTANHIATYTNTLGGLSQDPATAILAGGLQVSTNIVSTSGNISTTGGNIISSGQIIATGGNISTTAGNITSSGTITATSNIVTTAGNITSAGIITAVNGISTTAGSIISAGDIFANLGGVIAGLSSGVQGQLVLFSPTANNGRLIVTCTDAATNSTTTVQSGFMGQSTTYTIGDIGTSTGGIPVSVVPIRIKTIAGALVAGGSTTVNVIDAFCTSASNVQVAFSASTNAVSILKVTPTNGSFGIVCSADPEASSINYIIIK